MARTKMTARKSLSGTQSQVSLDNMTLAQLKDECSKRGFKAGDCRKAKKELLAMLSNGKNESVSKSRSKSASKSRSKSASKSRSKSASKSQSQTKSSSLTAADMMKMSAADVKAECVKRGFNAADCKKKKADIIAMLVGENSSSRGRSKSVSKSQSVHKTFTDKVEDMMKMSAAEIKAECVKRGFSAADCKKKKADIAAMLVHNESIDQTVSASRSRSASSSGVNYSTMSLPALKAACKDMGYSAAECKKKKADLIAMLTKGRTSASRSRSASASRSRSASASRSRSVSASRSRSASASRSRSVSASGVNYSTMSLPALKAACKDMGYSTAECKKKKADLIAMLTKVRTSASRSRSASSSRSRSASSSGVNYSTMSLPALKAACKDMGYSAAECKKKKADLIAMLTKGRTSASRSRSASASRKSPSKSRKSPSKSRKSPSKSRKSPSKSRKSPSKSRKSPSKSPTVPDYDKMKVSDLKKMCADAGYSTAECKKAKKDLVAMLKGKAPMKSPSKSGKSPSKSKSNDTKDKAAELRKKIAVKLTEKPADEYDRETLIKIMAIIDKNNNTK